MKIVRSVIHEDRLVADKLLLYLQSKKSDIFNMVKNYSTSDQPVIDKINSWSSVSEFEAEVNYFLNTHGDQSILQWIKNYITSNNPADMEKTYYDLEPLLRNIFANYMTTQLTSAEQGKFLQYYNQQNNTSHSGNLSFISSLTGANLEKCISDYLDFVLDNFCEAK